MWAAASCTATAGQALVQSLPTGTACQQWTFLPLGSGVYRITNGAGLSADAAGCAETAGTLLELSPASPLHCQRFRVERAADGTMVLAAFYGNRVVEVPNAATTAGVQLGLWDYNGCTCQHWALAAVGTTTATRSGLDAQVALFPNPAPGGSFAVQLPAGTNAMLTVTDINGRVVYRQAIGGGSGRNDVRAGLTAGAYVVRLATADGVVTRKLLTM